MGASLPFPSFLSSPCRLTLSYPFFVFPSIFALTPLPSSPTSSSILHSIVLETDSVAIASRVSRPRPDASVNLSDIQLNEQSILQVRPFRLFQPSSRTACFVRSTSIEGCDDDHEGEPAANP